MRSGLTVAIALGGMLGCSGAPSMIDGGPDSSAIDGGPGAVVVAPPAAPTPPDFSSCPSGWSTAATPSGVAHCLPAMPTGGDCPAGHAELTGGCMRIGTTCPSDGVPTGLPTEGQVLHVDSSVTDIGDGSLGAPYRDLDRAVRAARSGTTLALHAGPHLLAEEVPAGASLVGACPEQTTVSARDAAHILRVSSGTVTVSNLTIGRSSSRGVRVSGEGTTLVLEDVIVEQVHVIGVWASTGSRLEARRLAVRDISGHPLDGTLGVGLKLDTDTEVTIEGLSVLRVEAAGVACLGCTLSLIDGTVRQVDPQRSDGSLGLGVTLERGDADVTRVVVDRARAAGIYVGDATARLTLEHVVVRETRPEASTGDDGIGIRVNSGSLTARHVHVSGNRVRGLMVADGAQASVEDLIVLGTVGAADDGAGISVFNDSRLEGSRVVSEQNAHVGIVAGRGSTVELTDTVVRDTRRTGDRYGFGAVSYLGSSLSITRGLIERSSEGGARATEGSHMTLTDVVIRDTDAEAGLSDEAQLGVGAMSDIGSETFLRRVLVERSRVTGIAADRESLLEIEDVAVVDTRADARGEFGIGALAQAGGALSGSRLLVDGARDVGLAAFGGQVSLTDLRIEDVLAQACAPMCEDFGHGVLAEGGASVQLERFRIERAESCGVMISDTASITLVEGSVRDTTIGACIQVDGYDTATLQDEVHYLDNQSNLQATALPVPTPLPTQSF